MDPIPITIVYVFVLVLLALIPSSIAHSKGKDGPTWYLYGLLLFPIALIHSLLLQPSQKAIDTQKLAEGMRKCPFCAELIRPEAIVCRYCGRDIPVQERKATSPTSKTPPPEKGELLFALERMNYSAAIKMGLDESGIVTKAVVPIQRATKKKRILIPVLLLIAVTAAVVVIVIVTKKNKSTPGVEYLVGAKSVELNAKATYDGIFFAVINNDIFDWRGVSIAVREVPESRFAVEWKTIFVGAGDSYVIFASEFKEKFGGRVDPSLIKNFQVHVKCDAGSCNLKIDSKYEGRW